MGNQTTKPSGKDKPKKNVHWKTAGKKEKHSMPIKNEKFLIFD
jgi:hypothetical protein